MRIKDLPSTNNVSPQDFIVVDQNPSNPVTRRATLASALGQNAQAEVLSAVSGVDTVTATSAQAFTDYTAGQRFQFGTVGANTGAVTLAVNGLAAKAVVAVDGTALTAGALPAGTWVTVEYNGTAFTVLGYHVLRSSWGAGAVGNTPAGGIAATTVQGALNELDTEKVAFARLDDSDGSSLVGFQQAGTGAVTRTAQSKMRDVVSVKDFGAVGDGMADDTAAIQTAITASKNVFLPAGTYKITSPLYMTNGARLIGDGVGATTINKTTTTVGTGSNTARGGAISDSYAVDAVIILTHQNSGAFDDYAYNCEISNLQINSNSLNNAYAIYAPRAALFMMKNVETVGFQYGYTTFDTWMSSFERVTHNGNGRTSWRGFNWTLDSTSGPTGTSCNFMDCWARDGSGTGWYINSLGYTALNNCGADNITGAAYQFITAQITMNGCGMENITAIPSGSVLYFGNCIAVVNAMYGYYITGATGAFYTLLDTSNISFNNCRFTDFVTANGAYNIAVQSGTNLFDNATQWPTNGNTFISYNAGSQRVQPFTDSLITSSGAAYAVRSFTSGIRKENYSKAIGAGATNIFTLSMVGGVSSAFVNLRMFGNDSSFANGAIYQEVVFTFHQDGSYYQNSSIVNSTQAGNGLTTTPTYSIAQVAGIWTVSMTPGASGAIGNVTLIAEVLGVGATSTTFAWV